MKTIAITGGSGFVGHHLATLLVGKGYKVIIYSRSKKQASGSIQFAVWNPDEKKMDAAPLKDVDAVINLAGANVMEKRWTESYKAEIIRSRADATAFLLEQLRLHAPDCKTYIASSATGYYGPDRDGKPFSEDDLPFSDFLAQVCVQWERASLAAQKAYRIVVFRFGIVLGRDAGAFPQLTAPIKFGIMPILGNGRQMVSWIHIDDLCAMLTSALEDEHYSGTYNAVAPAPLPHKALMKAVASAKGGIRLPAPVPQFVLRIMMGESSIEVLKSCTVSAAKILAQGFHFQYPEIKAAIKSLTTNH